MPAMPRPSKEAKQIAYKILGEPNCLKEQKEKPKKKEAIDVEYELKSI